MVICMKGFNTMDLRVMSGDKFNTNLIKLDWNEGMTLFQKSFHVKLRQKTTSLLTNAEVSQKVYTCTYYNYSINNYILASTNILTKYLLLQ